MALPVTEFIWHNGKMIKWDDAKIHVLSHVVNYGSSLFEGIRCYETKSGPAIFRLKEHMQRLLNSSKIYRIDVPFSVDELCNAAVELVGANKVSPCYIRPIVLRGYGELGVNPIGCPTEVYMANYSWASISGTVDRMTAWMCACRRGRALRRTRCRRWRRPVRTT